MTGKTYLLFLLQVVWFTDSTLAQRSPYSLQAAVDELHHREGAKYPLNAPPSQQHFLGSSFGAGEQDYWDDDNAPSSIFRERETQVVNNPDRSELTEQFLREIEEAQEREREERYKDALRHLWEKYQQQENDLDGDLLEEKKRVRTPPYYMLMQKKRSYPVLPWLPYEKKKRFPVAKRSTKRAANDVTAFGKTDEKVARELSELFDAPIEEKRKRSAELIEKATTTHAPTATSTGLSDMHLEGTTSKRDNATTETNATPTTATAASAAEHHQHDGHVAHHGGHSQKQHKHRKRSEHSHESYEEGEDEEEEEHDDHDEHDEHEEEDEEEEKSFEDEEEVEERKKKREIEMASRHSNTAESVNNFPNQMLSSSRRKKSIEWSKYFGLDRKKKAMKLDDLDMRKRSTSNDHGNDDENKAKKKRDLDPEQLANMDKKLQSIEDFIIDETIKYTGSHEGITKPEEIRRLKDHVLSRLATAYSLEKMRRALDRLRQSVDNENHLVRNVIEADTRSDNDDSQEYQKRLSVKKEKANMAENDRKPHDINSNYMVEPTKNSDSDEEDEDITKKKKKRTNSYLRYPELPNDLSDFEEELGAGHYETLNDAYLGNKNYMIGSNQCPLIETMADRCRGVDLLSGDINQELLPICGVHQICYLCGTSQVACDYQYLAEADTICGNNNDCQVAARSVLMILRGTPSVQLGPRECLKNPCLYSAMREIGL